MTKRMKYWYDPNTGVILHRTEKNLGKFDLPYIENNEFDYYNYRVDPNTRQLIHEPIEIPTNPRGR